MEQLFLGDQTKNGTGLLIPDPIGLHMILLMKKLLLDLLWQVDEAQPQSLYYARDPEELIVLMHSFSEHLSECSYHIHDFSDTEWISSKVME